MGTASPVVRSSATSATATGSVRRAPRQRGGSFDSVPPTGGLALSTGHAETSSELPLTARRQARQRRELHGMDASCSFNVRSRCHRQLPGNGRADGSRGRSGHGATHAGKRHGQADLRLWGTRHRGRHRCAEQEAPRTAPIRRTYRLPHRRPAMGVPGSAFITANAGPGPGGHGASQRDDRSTERPDRNRDDHAPAGSPTCSRPRATRAPRSRPLSTISSPTSTRSRAGWTAPRPTDHPGCRLLDDGDEPTHGADRGGADVDHGGTASGLTSGPRLLGRRRRNGPSPPQTDPTLPPGTTPTSDPAAAFPESRAASPHELAFAGDDHPDHRSAPSGCAPRAAGFRPHRPAVREKSDGLPKARGGWSDRSGVLSPSRA